jgi:hypothetical protein
LMRCRADCTPRLQLPVRAEHMGPVKAMLRGR